MWVSDGSPEISIDGNKCICSVTSSQSNAYNALWKDDGIKSGKAYWKVAVEKLEDGLFVGVTDQDKFKQGWSSKGLSFGGNLSDGSCLLVGNFGPQPKEGDVIGIFVDVDDDKIKVYFDVNGRSLGLAFDVPRSTLGPQIFASLHFCGNGTASIQRILGAPSSTSREEEVFPGLLGNWRYTSGSIVADAQEVTFKIRGGPTDFDGFLHVVNNIGVSLKSTGTVGVWQGHPGASTMMMGSPEAMRLENEMTSLVSGTFSLNDAGQLVVSNGDKSGVWSRFTPSVKVVTENPFLN